MIVGYNCSFFIQKKLVLLYDYHKFPRHLNNCFVQVTFQILNTFDLQQYNSKKKLTQEAEPENI